MGKKRQKTGPKRVPKTKQQLMLEAIGAKFRKSYASGDFAAALDASTTAMRLDPNMQNPIADAALCNARLGQHEKAVELAHHALTKGPATLSILDILSQAYGGLEDWENVKKWGVLALETRGAMFDGPPLIAHDLPALPPKPSAATASSNVIAFSLFGASSKYCETAIWNAQLRPEIYPDWVCHFYVDESVPIDVVERLRKLGAQVIFVTDAQKSRFIGTMWRFLAYDTPNLHRVIFRDADSLISKREEKAVAAWIASGTHFHCLRDGPSQTELLLAGLWGCVAGALPNMEGLLEKFMQKEVKSAHFADQFFLREVVWPYAKHSLLTHDSFFGSFGAVPFPDGPKTSGFRVGSTEGLGRMKVFNTESDGTLVRWSLCDRGAGGEVVCSYDAQVQSQSYIIEIPQPYVERIQNGDLVIEQARK